MTMNDWRARPSNSYHRNQRLECPPFEFFSRQTMSGVPGLSFFPTCESSTLFFHRKDNGLDGVVEWSIPRRSVDDIDACTKLCVSRFLLTLYCRQREDGVVLNVLHVDRSTFTSCCTERAHKNSIHPERKQFRWCELRG